MVLKNRTRNVTVMVAIATMLFTAVPASAATGDGSFTATCDPAGYPYATNNVSYQHSSKGTISVKQKSTNPVLTSSVKLVSQNGNSTSVQNVSDGGTVSWTNVLAGQYKVYARSSSTVNCNGPGFGSGNYTFNYSITY